MNKPKVILLLVVMTLLGATAIACALMKDNRKLGNPGVKIVNEPVLDEKGNVARKESVDLPKTVLDFESKPMPITLEELRTLPDDTLFGRRSYLSPDRFRVDVSVVVMGVDSRSIHKPEICLPCQGWTIEGFPESVRMEKPFPYDLPLRKVIGTKTVQGADGKSQVVKTVYVYWFVAEDEITAVHADRMWKMGAEMLRSGVLQRWAYVACMSYCLPGQEDAVFARIQKFIQASTPEFQLPPGNSSPAQTASANATHLK